MASRAIVWLELGESTVNVPWSNVPCLKWQKYPLLELPGPRPSSLYRNAKLFPGKGGSSDILPLITSADVIWNWRFLPSTFLLKP